MQRVLIEPDRTGWARISDMVHKYDEDRIKDVKEDIDTLLVFVSRFIPTPCCVLHRLTYRFLGGSLLRRFDRFPGRDLYNIESRLERCYN